jgi:glutaredoxin-related protein
MKKQLNLTFIKQMIDLKFPFVQASGKKEVLNTVADRIEMKNKNYDVLEIFKMNSSLKQFIRIQDMISGDLKSNFSNLQIYV